MINKLKSRLLFAALLTTIVTAASGCVDNDPDPADRYPDGPVAPCDVVYDGSKDSDHEIDPSALEGASPLYWIRGPRPVWNTSPDAGCQNDPTIPLVREQKDVKMYITYPSRSAPTKTGDGRVAEGEWPVIIFAHANNDRVCGIYQGYYSLHDHWASWGFVVIGLDQTYTNCERGSKENIEIRSEGQIEAISALRAMNEDPEDLFYQRLDLEKIVFAGHSRGGGASLISAVAYPAALGVIDIQGVDITAFGFGAAPLPSTLPVIGITAGNDVDLNYPHVEPTEDQTSGEYTWVNINGGIHAYTADTAPLEPDDDPGITRKEQHDSTEYFTTAFLHKYVGVDQGQDSTGYDDVLFSGVGREIASDEITSGGVYTRWRQALETLMIDSFDRVDAGTNETGGATSSQGFDSADELATYQPADNPTGGMYGKATSLRLVGDGSYTTLLMGEVTPDADWLLEARVKGGDSGPAPSEYRVVLQTSSGEKRVDAHNFHGPLNLANRFSQLQIPVSAFGLSAGDIVESVSVEFSGGTLFIDDLRLTNP